MNKSLTRHGKIEHKEPRSKKNQVRLEAVTHKEGAVDQQAVEEYINNSNIASKIFMI
jgi:hypothetical protein